MEIFNPFKELEPDATCPPHLKTELISEIDLIRNAVTVVELYVGDLFGLVSSMLNSLQPPSDESTASL